MNLTLTEKEKSLLTDLSHQETICVQKYGEYASRASTPQLQKLFASIGQTEQQHYETLNGILDGRKTSAQKNKKPPMQPQDSRVTSKKRDDAADAFLCADALATEKYVSSVYDTSLFEFTSEKLRQTLNQIESEEQHHGKEIYDYMAKNGMY